MIFFSTLVCYKETRSSLFVEGYSYSVAYTYHGKTYLSCSARLSSNCRARAQIPAGAEQDELIITKDHSHPPDFFMEKKSKIWNIMKQFAMILPGNIAQVYSSVVSLYPETEKLFPFKKVEGSIRKFRRRHRWDLAT